MNKTISIQLGNIVVPFDCTVVQEGSDVVIHIKTESSKKADDLVTSLGADPVL